MGTLSLLAGAAAAGTSPRAGEPAVGSEPTSPTSVDERLAHIRERRSSLEQELTRLRGQERTLLGEVERLDLEVRLRTEELRETQAVLQKANQEMDVTQRRARVLEDDLARARPQLSARARALYKLGELSYLRLLLSVEQPADLLRGYRYVTALARRDHDRVAAFRKDLRDLEETRARIQQRAQEALQLRAQIEQGRQRLTAERRRKTELLTQIVQQKETQAAYVAELEAAEERLGRLLQGLPDGEDTVPIAAFRGSLPWPVAGRLRSGFGRRKHPRFDTYTVQNGIDIAAAPEAPVQAVHEGTVVFCDRFLGYGVMVVLDHGGKHHTLYAHLSDLDVRLGQRVRAGQRLGRVGNTSLVGPGLYFETRFQGRPEDPLEWLRRRSPGNPL